MNDTDEEWNASMAKTGYTCLFSDEAILYGDEVVVFHVVAASRNKRQDMPVSPDGASLLWLPKFVLGEAWNDINERLQEEVAEEELEVKADPESLCECEYCENGIRQGELYVLAVWGAIQVSQRRPSGQGGGHTFDDRDEAPTAICLNCYRVCHERVLAVWDYPVRQYQECEHGAANQCWRYGCDANENGRCDLSRKPRAALA